MLGRLLLEVAKGLLEDEGLARPLAVLREHVQLQRLRRAHVRQLEARAAVRHLEWKKNNTVKT